MGRRRAFRAPPPRRHRRGRDVERSTVDAQQRLLRHRRRRPAGPRRAAAAARRRRRHRLAAEGAGRRRTRRDPHRAVRHTAVGVDRRPDRHAAGQTVGECGDDPHDARPVSDHRPPAQSALRRGRRRPRARIGRPSAAGVARDRGRTRPRRSLGAPSAHQTADGGGRQTRPLSIQTRPGLPHDAPEARAAPPRAGPWRVT